VTQKNIVLDLSYITNFGN